MPPPCSPFSPHLLFPQELFTTYAKWQGHVTQNKALAAHDKFGENRFEVPVPPFGDLLKDQLTAPFFCFQVKSKVGLRGAWGVNADKQVCNGFCMGLKVCQGSTVGFGRASGVGRLVLGAVMDLVWGHGGPGGREGAFDRICKGFLGKLWRGSIGALMGLLMGLWWNFVGAPMSAWWGPNVRGGCKGGLGMARIAPSTCQVGCEL